MPCLKSIRCHPCDREATYAPIFVVRAVADAALRLLLLHEEGMLGVRVQVPAAQLSRLGLRRFIVDVLPPAGAILVLVSRTVHQVRRPANPGVRRGREARVRAASKACLPVEAVMCGSDISRRIGPRRCVADERSSRQVSPRLRFGLV